MQLNLSINKNIINKGNPAQAGWKNVTLTVNSFVEHVANGFAYSGGFLKPDSSDKKPRISDVDFSEVVSLDIDNVTLKFDSKTGKKQKVKKTKEQGYISFDDICKDKFIMKYALFAYQTPSSTHEHNRFRIVFALSRKIYNPETYSAIADFLIRKFGADTACKDIARLFYGSAGATIKRFNNSLDVDQVLNQIQAKEQAEEIYNRKKIDFDHIDLKTLNSMLAKIPSQQSYQHWFSILVDIAMYYKDIDFDGAVQVVDRWSADTDVGTEAKMKSIISSPYFINKYKNKPADLENVIKQAIAGGYNVEPLSKSSSSINVDQDSGEIILSDIERIESWIEDYASFRKNVITGKIEIKRHDFDKYEEFDDRFERELWRELYKNHKDVGIPKNIVKKEFIRDIIFSEFSEEHDVFLEFFQNLPEWNNQDYFQEVADTISFPSQFEKDKFQLYFAKWFVGLVAQATLYKSESTKDFGGANQVCLTLLGKQGSGKSMFISSIIPEQLKKYLAFRTINPSAKDDEILLAEKLVIAMDELDAVTFKKDVAALKAYMTKNQISVRKPYERHSVTMERRASFYGAVNNATFLNDDTGSRRFLVVEIDQIDIEKLKAIDLIQLYSQAYSMLLSGFKYWLTGEEITVVNSNNEEYQITNLEEELISKYFTPDDENGFGTKYLMTSEIIDYLSSKIHSNHKLQPQRLTNSLRKLGFQQKSRRIGSGVVRRCWSLSYVEFEDVEEEKTNF